MSSDGVPSSTGYATSAASDRDDLPGSDGEHVLQERFETVDRADSFYEEAMQSALTDRMRAFLEERWIGLLGTLEDGRPRVRTAVGQPGMVQVFDAETVGLPVGRAIDDAPSLEGAHDNRWLSLVTVDWWDTTVGLHVNGVAERRATRPDRVDGDAETDWLVLSVHEAYIHCAKHIPRLSVDIGPSTERSADSPLREVLERAYSHCANRISGLAGTGQQDPQRESHDRLVPEVQQFIGSRILGFLATADGEGEMDVSPRIGPEGFVQIVDDTTIAWPEYRGNGIHASLGNIYERPVASMTFVDWWETEASVQVTGEASLRDEVDGATDLTDVDRTKTWVVLDVESVRVTVDPPLPKLSIEAFDPPWGTDDSEAKKSGFFTT